MNFWRLFRANRAAEPTQSAGTNELQPSARTNQGQMETGSVAGERGVASINRTRSIQSRLSSILAAGLMSVLALGFLAWYYTHTFARRSQAEAATESKLKKQAQAEMKLPPLGRVDPPVVERMLGAPPDPPPLSTLPSEPLAVSEPRPYTAQSGYGDGSTAMFGQQHLSQRRLAGPVFVSAAKEGAGPNPGVAAPTYISEEVGLPSASSNRTEPGPGTSALTELLQPTSTPAVKAKVLPTERLLLPKGAFLDCTLETAIDSSLPGMTTCVTATDTFGTDGTVVLLERGTKLVGETRGDVQHGTARVYVLWTEARTPAGVVVPLASPGTDELGRAGLPGEVNHHFWERFGAAILISVIDGAVQSAVQTAGDGNGAVVVNPSTSRDIMTEVLRSTVNIPPTVTKQNGDRIAVLVARDLDFRSVYELRCAAETCGRSSP
jgi:type IV secretion system protein VirB10